MKTNYKNYQSSAGFTLIELLVAASITTLVVSIAGSSLVSIMQNNSKAEAETLRRVQLNRALDFISDEVRTAKTIAKDASANLATVAPGFNPSDKTLVLTLEIPDVSQRVIYYTGTPSTTSVWFDPKAPDAKMIYRWGPTFGNDGQYTNADNDPPVGCNSFTTCNPRSWDGNALVDLIADTTPISATTCPGLTGWTANPSTNNGQGFTACVDPTGKIAKINLRGELRDAYNNSRPPFEVSTKTFARPYTPTFTVNSGSSISGGNGGTMTITQPSV
jgi:prepilin-type N-terminal cleavage/methylation domain-containing protein